MFDTEGRGPSTGVLVLRGVCVSLVIVFVAGALLARYTGMWRNTVDVVASMPSLGDGLPQHADVKFRGVLVGAVADVSADGAGSSAVGIRLDPARAETIPAGVTARVVPSNIFAVSSIELIDTGDSDGVLQAGAHISGDTTAETIELQTAMTSLRNVLGAVDPEKSSAVLSTLANALSGQGDKIGNSITMSSTYLTTLRSEIPDLAGDLERLDSAIESLGRTAPELLDTLGSSLLPAATLADKREELASFLTSAGGAVNGLGEAVAPNLSGAIGLVRDLDPVMAALAVNGDDLPVGVRAFGATLDGFNRAFTGPNGRLIWSIDITATPFTPYTRADCPRYGPMAGASCSTAPLAAAQTMFGPDTVDEIAYGGGNLGSIGSPAERDVIGEILGRPADAASIVLLGPLLRGSVVAVDNEQGPPR